jgi:hypothetical protein
LRCGRLKNKAKNSVVTTTEASAFGRDCCFYLRHAPRIAHSGLAITLQALLDCVAFAADVLARSSSFSSPIQRRKCDMNRLCRIDEASGSQAAHERRVADRGQRGLSSNGFNTLKAII